MNALAAALESVDAALDALVADTVSGDVMPRLTDGDLLELVGVAARIHRRAESLLIEGAAQIDYRSTVPPAEERVTTRFGCRTPSELLQRVMRVSGRTASNLLTAGRAIVRDIAPSSGELLPPEFPQLRGEVGAGRVGLDGVLAVTVPLARVAMVAGRAAHAAADEELSAVIRGEGADGGPVPCADDLRALATVWAAYLDQDGAEPREAAALRKRGLTLGVCRDGLVPVRGNLLPDVAAQLKLVFDSILNPKAGNTGSGGTAGDTGAGAVAAVEGAAVVGGGAAGTDGAAAGGSSGPRFVETDPAGAEYPATDDVDVRSRSQKQHDAFATAIFTIARSGALPTLGGAAPTLVVTVRAEDLATGRGYAHIDGVDEPVSLATARHVACTGAVQRAIFDPRGRVIGVETSDRIFTTHQRRALGARDGNCLIPGCHVPAAWCEIHHVQESARGGPTSTDNGVPLCFFHHRTIDTGPWRIRMNQGVPEVRGPNWWDHTGRWWPVTASPTRMLDRLHRRA